MRHQNAAWQRWCIIMTTLITFSTISESSKTTCDFESGFCDWKNLPRNDLDWRLRSGSTLSAETGPTTDHTKGTSLGHYVYIETSGASNAQAVLASSVVTNSNETTCKLSMAYHMYGSQIGTLEVIAHTTYGNSPVWRRFGNQGRWWLTTTVDFGSINGSFEIYVRASHSFGFRGDIALDDLSLTNCSPDVTPTSSSVSCYFCSQSNKENCEIHQTVNKCGVGELCRQVVHRLPLVFGGGVTSFQRHCFPKSSCTDSDECKGAFGGYCIRCCDSNVCNNGSISIENPTTGVAPTMASSSILCYDCSTTSQEYCEVHQIVQTCNVGDVCRQVVHRLAPIFGGGVTSFQRGCFPNSRCTESNECKGVYGGNCISCCNRNFCNNGAIDNLTTETLVPTTDGGFWHRTASPSAHDWWWHTTAAYPHDFWWWYTTSPPRKDDKSATPIIVGITVSVISAVLVFVIVLIVIILVRRRKGTTSTTTTASAQASAGQPAQAQSAIFVPSAYLSVTYPSLHFNSYEKLEAPPSYETVTGYRGDSESVNSDRMSQQHLA